MHSIELRARPDQLLLREGLKLARKIGNTAPLSSAMLAEISPGPSVQSDGDWDTWVANAFGTEFHPSCSCAMLPLNLGGVVDSDLKVYGTSKLDRHTLSDKRADPSCPPGNVRVADASVFPIQFAAHVRIHHSLPSFYLTIDYLRSFKHLFSVLLNRPRLLFELSGMGFLLRLQAR